MQYLMIFAILFPMAAALGIMNNKVKGSLDSLHKYVFAASLINSAVLLYTVFFADIEPMTLISFTGGLDVVLAIDGLSKVFIMIIAVLWPLTTLYAFDYMKHEGGEPRFFAFFLLSYGVSAGIAFAGNLVTMYMFFEMLTMATLPLVMHKMDDKARFAGRRYLIYSIAGASLGFMAIVFTHTYGGSGGFVLGGIMGGIADEAAAHDLRIAFTLAFFGFGVKAAIFPASLWLPSASVAPTPVTALLHAAAVVKAGAFACIRLTYYTFGTDMLAGTFAQYIPMAAAILTIALGSLLALRSNHLKRRLAWSTVSNLSYILFAVTLMSNMGLKAACLHMLTHAFVKITLFFGVGSVLISSEKEYLDEIGGLAHRMPVTFACFTVASAALMGVPPMPGFFSKWAIGTAAEYSGKLLPVFGIGALMISAFLTAAYLMSIISKAYFPEDGRKASGDIKEMPRMKAVQAALCLIIVLMGIFSQNIQSALSAWLF